MAYQLFDREGNRVSNKDLQNKARWCEHGASLEETFVSMFGKTYGISIHPDKSTNKYAPDLLIKEKFIADLKTQNTPFFKARELFGFDPNYVVVFNKKDLVRYTKLYPDIYILFWVRWEALQMQMGEKTYHVNPMSGLWWSPLHELKVLCKKAPLHSYTQRKNDQKGNAKSSYILQLTDMKQLT